MEHIVTHNLKVEAVGGDEPWKEWYPQHAEKFISGINDIYELDWSAIDKACKWLGINERPNITFDAWSVGAETSIYADGRVQIVLAKYVTAVYADLMLWHELTHFKQILDKRFTFDGDKMICANTIGWREYWEYPLEAEAREVEKRGREYPLVQSVVLKAYERKTVDFDVVLTKL